MATRGIRPSLVTPAAPGAFYGARLNANVAFSRRLGMEAAARREFKIHEEHFDDTSNGVLSRCFSIVSKLDDTGLLT